MLGEEILEFRRHSVQSWLDEAFSSLLSRIEILLRPLASPWKSC